MKLDKELISMLNSHLLDEFGNPDYEVIVGAILAGIEGRAKNVESAIKIAFSEYNHEE